MGGIGDVALLDGSIMDECGLLLARVYRLRGVA